MSQEIGNPPIRHTTKINTTKIKVPDMTDDQLRDKYEIEQLLIKYGRACDSLDRDLFRSLFTEDAHIDFVSSIGVEGSRDEIAEWLCTALGMMDFIQHYITNIESEITGDTATARAMFYTPLRLPDFTELSYTGGYYHLSLVRTDSGWRISRLREEAIWSVNIPEPDTEIAVPPLPNQA
jgi:SnoaL-like domain